jgi:nitroreductase
MKSSSENQACTLEAIIAARRTVRRFTSQVPPRDMVERVVKAGLLAPYSGLGVSGEEFRRIIVTPRESPAMAQATALIRRGTRASKEQLEAEMQRDPQVRANGQAYLQVLQMAQREDIPMLAKAPYYIVIAEQRGIPHVEHCSLAHAMQNMWLEATALGLGFQLLTATQRLSGDQDFCTLLGLPFGAFEVDGCLLGYAAEAPAPVPRPDARKVVSWL